MKAPCYAINLLIFIMAVVEYIKYDIYEKEAVRMIFSDSLWRETTCYEMRRASI